MINIIAHRGLWNKVSEQNTMRAFELAFKNGFGVETDIRDYVGRLVINHNIADELSQDLEIMLECYTKMRCETVLALNVKADGIQELLKPLLKKYKITNYFLFDMSVPEMVVNIKEKLTVYTRHSDIEQECVMYEYADGVWIDAFYNMLWITKEILLGHIEKGKQVGIISPEIHGYDKYVLWDMLKDDELSGTKNISLCTDTPIEARRYFNE